MYTALWLTRDTETSVVSDHWGGIRDIVCVMWGYDDDDEKLCDIMNGILCAALQFLLLCCVLKRIELFW